MEALFQKALQNQKRLLRELSVPARRHENLLTQRASLLIGPRGVGKSTLLLNLVKQDPEKTLYISMDNPIFANLNLYEFGEWVFQNGINNFILDEIHNYAQWSNHLKAIYDSFPQKKIIATDSSSLVVRQGLGDLSRRFLISRMSYLSFREYIEIKFQKTLAPIFFSEILNEKKISRATEDINHFFEQHGLSLQKEFKLYLNEGCRPFFLEGHYEQRQLQIIEKVIFQDIPLFLPEIRPNHLSLMKAVVGYLAESPIPTINLDSMSKTWSISKPTVYNLLNVLHESDLIRIIPREGNTKVKSKGAKIFFGDVSFYHSLQGNLGNRRESFFCMQMAMLGKVIAASKKETEYDFCVNDITFEIGGKNKDKKNANIVLKDDTNETYKKNYPLWIIGFLST